MHPAWFPDPGNHSVAYPKSGDPSEDFLSTAHGLFTFDRGVGHLRTHWFFTRIILLFV